MNSAQADPISFQRNVILGLLLALAAFFFFFFFFFFINLLGSLRIAMVERA